MTGNPTDYTSYFKSTLLLCLIHSTFYFLLGNANFAIFKHRYLGKCKHFYLLMPLRKAKGLDFLENNDLRKHVNLSIFPGFSNSIILPTPNKTFYCYQRLQLAQHNRKGGALNWKLGTRVQISTVPWTSCHTDFGQSFNLSGLKPQTWGNWHKMSGN